MDRPVALMVVSDLLMRQSVEEGLRAAGYDPVGASGITRMRERLERHRPVVAVVDLETDGLDLVEAIGELTARDIPALGFCGHTDRDLREAGLAAGCRRVVTRGEIAARLDRLVTGIVGGPSATVSG